MVYLLQLVISIAILGAGTAYLAHYVNQTDKSADVKRLPVEDYAKAA